MTFGERVNIKRKEKGITQDELAQKLGYKSRSSIAKIENGDRDVPRPMIIELAKALDTTPAYLMGWEDKENTTKESVHPIKPEDVRVIIREDKKVPPITTTEDALIERLSQYSKEELQELFLYLDFLDYKRGL